MEYEVGKKKGLFYYCYALLSLNAIMRSQPYILFLCKASMQHLNFRLFSFHFNFFAYKVNQNSDAHELLFASWEIH